ncbi:MAG: tetratricopeptide repeat protein [Promethearchaeota archaeon]
MRRFRLTRLKGNVFVFKGDERESLKYQEEAILIAEEINDLRLISTSLNNLAERYRILGDLDQALIYGKRCITFYNKFLSNKSVVGLAFGLSTTLDIALEMGNIELAKSCLLRLEQLNNQEENELIDLFYREGYAYVLKSSPRLRNRVKAEDILRKIIEEHVIHFESSVKALINLCELLLSELQITKDSEILEEIQLLITRLSDMA